VGRYPWRKQDGGGGRVFGGRARREKLARARLPDQPRDCRRDLMGRRDLYQRVVCLYRV